MERYYWFSMTVLVLYTTERTLCFDPSTCIECRNSHVCNPPDCFCCRDTMPISSIRNIPQMVFFTFDDAVTPQVAAYYRELFESSRLNPNGCPIKMTLFISHSNTVYSLVKEFYQKGMEIASHSVTHSHPSSSTFPKEARKQKENLAKKAGIPEKDIKGWRSPFLEPLGDTQPDVLKSLGYEYDATLTVNKKSITDKAVTPFTLDFGWPYDCKIKPCPKKSHKGFWEVPVVSVKDYMKQYDCVYVDGCNNPPPSEDLAYKFLWDNFQAYYTNNRAPMGINMHASWFYYPDRKAAMNRFIQDLVKMDDVFIVSISQVIEWLKQPTPLSHIKEFKPWKCDNGSDSSKSPDTLSGFDARQMQMQQLYDSRQREMLRQRQMAEEQRRQWQQQQLLMHQQSQNNLPRSRGLIHGTGRTLITQIQPSQSTQWQQQQTIQQTMRNTLTPPMSPNFPLVRFWWRPPEGMNLAMQQQYQLRNNLQMEQVLRQRQQQIDQQRARLRTEQMKGQQRITNGDAVKPKTVVKLKGERLSVQERNKKIKLDKIKFNEIKQKKVTRQRGLEEEAEEKRKQDLKSKNGEQLKLQRATEIHIREQQRRKESKLREMLKQKKIEKQRLEQVRRQEILKLKGFKFGIEEGTTKANTMINQIAVKLQNSPKKHSAEISKKLDGILQYDEPERIRKLEQLSLKDLVKLQVELRRRLNNKAVTTANRSSAQVVSTGNGRTYASKNVGKQTEARQISTLKPIELSNQVHSSSEQSAFESFAPGEKFQLHAKTKLDNIEPVTQETEQLFLKPSTTTLIPETLKAKFSVLPSTKVAQTIVTPIPEIDSKKYSPVVQKQIKRIRHINGDLKSPSLSLRKWTPDEQMTKLASGEKILMKTTPKPPSKPRVFQFFSLDQIMTAKPVFSTSPRKTAYNPVSINSHIDILNKHTKRASMKQAHVAALQHTPVPIRLFNSGIPYSVSRVQNKDRSVNAYSKSSASVTITKTTTPKPVMNPTNDIYSVMPKIAARLSLKSSERISKLGSVYVPSLNSFPKPSSEGTFSSADMENACLQGVNCIKPACVCKSNSPPKRLQMKDIPQIIHLSIDGTLNFNTYSKIRTLLSPGRKNPNNCRITGTLFISDKGSNYRMANSLKVMGNEIAMMGSKVEPYTNATVLDRDIQRQKVKISERSELLPEDIKGWRSPGFAPLGDDQFRTLAQNGMYDSSIFVKGNLSRSQYLWPFTMDFGWKGRCEFGTCPQAAHPGVWEVPIMPFFGPNNSPDCDYTDGCSFQPITEAETMTYLMENFNRFYEGNKAPFSIRLKQMWFHWYYRESLSGLLKFLDTVLSFGDVYVMSVRNMLEWMKNPTPLSDIGQFKPWKC